MTERGEGSGRPESEAAEGSAPSAEQSETAVEAEPGPEKLIPVLHYTLDREGRHTRSARWETPDKGLAFWQADIEGAAANPTALRVQAEAARELGLVQVAKGPDGADGVYASEHPSSQQIVDLFA